jgi:hypothetical protein
LESGEVVALRQKDRNVILKNEGYERELEKLVKNM